MGLDLTCEHGTVITRGDCPECVAAITPQPTTIKPATITVPMTDAEGREVGWRVDHPDGVECDFSDGQCTCGRLNIGITRA